MQAIRILLLVGLCWLGTAAVLQAQQKCGKTSTAVTTPPTPKRVDRLPTNYRPPVADPKRITFPETHANKKRQRKLRKRRKKSGRKGCPAARL